MMKLVLKSFFSSGLYISAFQSGKSIVYQMQGSYELPECLTIIYEQNPL